MAMAANHPTSFQDNALFLSCSTVTCDGAMQGRGSTGRCEVEAAHPQRLAQALDSAATQLLIAPRHLRTGQLYKVSLAGKAVKVSVRLHT